MTAMVNSVVLALVIVISAHREAEAQKSVLHAGVTTACRSMVKLYENDDNIVDGTRDLSVICSGPGGLDKLILPVNAAAATQIIGLEVLDPNADTVITIHGFNDNPESAIPFTIADGYLAKGKYNVIQLDSRKVTAESYLKSVHASWQIGEIFAKFLSRLYGAGVLKPSKTHIIGISLGAHTAGRTGRMFKKYTGKKVGRITGLDPAGPCFEYSNKGLNKRDAKYVDNIHSNQGIEGIVEGLGHVDYLVNGGGPNQPGCNSPSCSHQRAALLYIVSMSRNNEPLFARKCNSWFNFMGGLCDKNDMATMGFNTTMTKKGFYYLKTGPEWPYTMGMNGSVSGSNKAFYRILG